jgi:hypothetical protein
MTGKMPIPFGYKKDFSVEFGDFHPSGHFEFHHRGKTFHSI